MRRLHVIEVARKAQREKNRSKEAKKKVVKSQKKT